MGNQSKEEQIAQLESEIKDLRGQLSDARAMASAVPFLLGLVRHFAGDRRFSGLGGKGWIGLAERGSRPFWKAFITENGGQWCASDAKALQRVQDGLSPIVDGWELEQ